MLTSDAPVTAANKRPSSQIYWIRHDEPLGRTVQHLQTDEIPPADPGSPVWIHIDGLGTPDRITEIAGKLGLHPLTVEDILSPKQRDKVEDYEGTLFIVVRDYRLKDSHRFATRQVSIAFGENFILTVQERAGEPFTTVLDNLNRRKGQSPETTDMIAYLFIDAVVDHLSIVLEDFGDHIERLESAPLAVPNNRMVKTVHGLRRETTRMRRSLWPLHEAIGQLFRSGSTLLHPTARTYLRDVEDHINRAIEQVDGYRDGASELLDLYLSTMSNRMNEIMKLLTIISTTFIPINFLAAVYGMNFENMPELGWSVGYPLFWLIVAGIIATMLTVFRKKRWL